MALTPFSSNKPQRNDRSTFSNRVDAFVTWLLDTFWTELVDTVAQINVNVARAESAVSAVDNNKWVSGSYTEGDVAWSPTDHLDYRCRNTGSRTIDPALDPTNWALRTSTSLGGSDTQTSAVNITLDLTSSRLQAISMTAPGKKVTHPNATTLKKETLVFVYRNVGIYRFSVHKYDGSFICYVNPGQIVAVHCSDISTSAGVWHVSGQGVEQIYTGNTAEILNATDSRNIAVAMLSATQAICAFRDNSSTYPNAVVLNYGSASGSPAQLNNEAAVDISIAAQTSNQATVVYKTSTGATKAVVLDITSSTTFSTGTVKQIDAATGGSGTAVASLSSTQLLAVYQAGSGGTPRMRILDIVSSAVNESAEVVADAAFSSGTYLRAGKVSSSKALVAFRDNTSKKIQLRLQSISGSTPAPTDSVLDLSSMPGTNQNLQFGMVVLSSSRAAIISAVDRTYYDLMVSLFDISGSSPVLLCSRLFSFGIGATTHVTATKLDDNNLYVTMTGGFGLGVDGMRIRITGDDNILLGTIAENIEPGVTASGFYVGVAALDSAHVVQVARNANTYLSAKTLEIGS